MSVAERLAALTPEQRALFEKLREKQQQAARAPKAPAIPRVTGPTGEGDWPLSLDQERYWLMEQLYPQGAGLNLGSASRMRGPVSVPVVMAALDELARRHATWRTTFPLAGDGPVQRVAPTGRQRLAFIDLTGLLPARREAEALRLAKEESAVPFDLQRGPLVRASLLRLGADDHLCLLTLHHTIADGLSFPVLWSELAVLCAAFAAGRPAALPEPPVHYADFAVWQRGWLRGEVLEGLVSWWRERLAEVPLVLDLPLDWPRPAVARMRGGQVVESLPAALSEQLRALSRGEGATLFMTGLAAFAALLHRHSGQEELILGANNANRNRPEIETVLGCFVTQVPFPIDLAGDPTFRELLARVRQSALGVYAHQDLPFGKLVEALHPERELNRQPIVQALVQVLDGKPSGGGLAGLSFEPLSVFDGNARYDLMLTLFDRPEGLLGELEYDADLFEEGTAARLFERLQRLLEAVAADPDLRLSAIPLLSAAEREQLRRDERTPALGPSPALPVHETIAAVARRQPESLAVVRGEERWSYGELMGRANALAWRLRRLGVGPEVRVAVCAERSASLVAALLGVMAAGGAYLPIDPEDSPARIGFVLADSGAAVLVTDSTVAARLPAALPRVLLDDPLPPAPAPPASGLLPGNLAYVIYTSGSTGAPKGVGVSHAAFAAHVATWARVHGVGPADRFLQFNSASFDPAVEQVATVLTSGAALMMRGPEMWEGEELTARVAALELTVVDLPTSVWSRWVAGPLAAADLPPSVRRVLIGGEELRAGHAREWHRKGLSHLPLLNGYGPTEAVVSATQHEVGPHDGEVGRISIGRPLPGRAARVLGRWGEERPVGAPGELCLGGPLARGYLGRPALTAERFVPDPFAEEPGARLYRSGDLARWRPDGGLEFLGRVDDQVKIRGFRVEPGEVAAALLAHPAVRQAEVVARSDRSNRSDLSLVAYVVGEGLDAADLRAFLRGRLPEAMVPAAFVLLEALPLTPHGKVDRRALPPPPEAAELAGSAPPRDTREERLAAVWRLVLGLERLGIHDNFFQLGGDSILAIQVVARARREGLMLTTRQLFEHQTIAALAAAAGSAGPEAGEEQGPVEGEAPLTPVQRRFFAEERRRPWHYNQAVVLVPRRRLAAPALAAALDRLIRHHDALRLRFVGQQPIHAPVAPVPLLEVDLMAAPAALAALAAAMEELQSGLDLERGPLFTAALFRLTDGDRLLLTAHHLVVDGVSWRVLVEDLATALEGRELPPKTTSWKRWAELLAGYSRSPELEAELPYWLDQPGVPPLPRDLPGGGGAVATVAVELGRDATRALLQEVPEVYRTRVDDLLLAALARAFAAWTGEGAHRVELEGHGREEMSPGVPGVDLSRTVGWFTTLYPVVLALPPGGGPREAIRAVKETLRAVPGRGLGYGLLRYLPGPGRLALPAPEVSFNYLGRLDAAAGEADLLAFAPETVRNALGEVPAVRPSFAIDALVVDDRLRVSWTYDPGRHLPATAERLARGFLAEIEALVEHCLSPAAGGFTPSDFPLAALSQADLDRLLGDDRSVEDLYPLAPMQEGLLFHGLYAGAGADLYFEQLTAELEGDLDETAFAAAWQRVVERHTALRTGFLWHGVERPLQLVRRAAGIPWTREDWRGLAPAEVEARWRELLAADRARGFDLSCPPLLRLALARTGERTRRLVWSSHHILLDGWCFPLLLNEVLTLYGSAGAALPPARPYRDYVAWLRGRDEGEALRCWRRRLEGFTAPTPVPFDLPGALGRAQGGRPEDYFEREAALPAHLLEGLAQRLRVTLNTVVQGAWALLLSRYAQERDVIFGAVVSGRPAELPGVESMVGLFINTVPVRVEVPEDEPASAWLPRLQAGQIELRQHEWTPLAEIQKLVDLPPGEPLFASLLVFENYPFDTVAAGGAGGPRITRAALAERTNYPLTLTVVARGEMSLRLTADRRFEPATVRRLLAHLERLLEGLAADPETPPASLPLLAAAERHQLTAEWSGAADVQPSRATIPALFAAQAARTPHAVAVVCGEEEITYAELDRRARRVAGRLLRRGVAPETRVAVPAERSLDLIPTLLGILQAGCAYLPVDPQLPEERRRFFLADAGAILLDAEEGPEEGEEALELPAVSPRQLAYVIYTSGSTGVPKGVEVTHGNVARLVTGADYAPLGPGETLLQVCNVAFDVSTFEIWGPLLNGGRLAVFPGHPEPDGLARAIARHGVSTLWLTAGLFHLMAQERLEGLRPLRRLLAGGDALAPAPVRRVLAGLPGCALIDGYGPTENTAFTTRHVMTAADLADQRLATTVPIGRPLRGTTVHVLDEVLRPVPVGVWGELCTGGEGVARGYLARPSLTAERFVPDPWGDGGRLYRTGDVVRWRPDGLLEFLGRRDGQVKIRGFRVELGEIEAALTRQPGVREAAVLARSDRSDGSLADPRLVAYVTGDAAAGDLRAALRERLPDYMIPAAFVFLDRLPLTPNGKVDRRALPSPDPAAGRAREHVAPANAVEESLAAACAEVLERERVGMRDNFFELGGHSLLATRLVIRLRDRYGLDVPLQTVFDAADLRDLADRVIGQGLAAAADGLSPEELEALLAEEPPQPDGVV